MADRRPTRKKKQKKDFKLDPNYSEVKERIQQFYARFPNGSLRAKEDPRVVEIGERTFIRYAALAYRTPDDPIPAEGYAWEPFPGNTPYTADSELMNAETSAWGRAIAAAGVAVDKGIATADEIRNRQASVAMLREEPRPEQAERPEQPEQEEKDTGGKTVAGEIVHLRNIVKQIQELETGNRDWSEFVGRSVAKKYDGRAISDLSVEELGAVIAGLRNVRDEMREAAA